MEEQEDNVRQEQVSEDTVIEIHDHGHDSGLSVEISSDDTDDREQTTHIVGAREHSPSSDDFEKLQ